MIINQEIVYVGDDNEMDVVVDRIMSPPHTHPKMSVYFLVPRTCECYLKSKRDFVNVMKLKILRWED